MIVSDFAVLSGSLGTLSNDGFSGNSVNQMLFKEAARLEKNRGSGKPSSLWPRNVQVLQQCDICTCSNQTLGFSRMQIEELYTRMALSLEIPCLPTLVF